MGVPSLCHYYYKKYNKTNELTIEPSELSKINVCDLFFDSNSLFHPCAYQILAANHDKYLLIDNLDVRCELIEKDIITNCINYTKLIISQVLPENVYLVIDGVAPRSKMNQQRERRYKSEFLRKPGEIPLWDSNKITPGTRFMDKLIKKLKDISCILSDSNEPGEGEHKIMKIIEQNKRQNNSKTLIYGLDGDLIFLSVLHKFSDNIILIRDNSLNSTLSDDKKVIDFVNIKNLRGYIYKDFSNILQQTKHGKNIECIRLIDDYVFLCFFLGNDFLEHLPSLYIRKNAIETLIKAYSNAYKGEYLIDFSNVKSQQNQILNINFFKDIMYQLKNHEIYFFKSYNNEFFTESELTDVIEKDQKVYFYDSKNILNFKNKDYKKRYNIYYDIKTNVLNDVCLNYIEGLLWVFYYYKGHIHQNWSWYYRYHNSPFCSDLFEFAKNNSKLIDDLSFKEDKPFSPIKQLCLVLPKKSLLYILKELNYNNTHPLILFINNETLYYPDKLFIDIINKRYLWQSKIFFEKIDDDIIDLFI